MHKGSKTFRIGAKLLMPADFIVEPYSPLQNVKMFWRHCGWKICRCLIVSPQFTRIKMPIFFQFCQIYFGARFYMSIYRIYVSTTLGYLYLQFALEFSDFFFFGIRLNVMANINFLSLQEIFITNPDLKLASYTILAICFEMLGNAIIF